MIIPGVEPVALRIPFSAVPRGGLLIVSEEFSLGLFVDVEGVTAEGVLGRIDFREKSKAARTYRSLHRGLGTGFPDVPDRIDT